jgi:hypothetical protein
VLPATTPQALRHIQTETLPTDQVARLPASAVAKSRLTSYSLCYLHQRSQLGTRSNLIFFLQLYSGGKSLLSLKQY